MTSDPQRTHPPDICLLLRAHSEQHWLLSEIAPLVRQLELPGAVADRELGAALAYLEVLWLGACRRARETDSAYAKLNPADPGSDPVIYEHARRYRAAVRRQRSALSSRVSALTGLHAPAPRHEHAQS